eukprot:gene11746-34469_t
MKNNRGKKKVGARASVSGAGAEQERLRKRCERHRFGWACFLSLPVVFLAGLLGPGMAADGISALSKAVRSVSFVQAQIVGVRLSHNASVQFSPGNGLFADPFQDSFCPLHTATSNQTVPPPRTSVRPLFAGKIHFPPVFSSGLWRRWNALSQGNAPKDRAHVTYFTWTPRARVGPRYCRDSHPRAVMRKHTILLNFLRYSHSAWNPPVAIMAAVKFVGGEVANPMFNKIESVDIAADESKGSSAAQNWNVGCRNVRMALQMSASFKTLSDRQEINEIKPSQLRHIEDLGERVNNPRQATRT